MKFSIYGKSLCKAYVKKVFLKIHPNSKLIYSGVNCIVQMDSDFTANISLNSEFFSLTFHFFLSNLMKF